MHKLSRLIVLLSLLALAACGSDSNSRRGGSTEPAPEPVPEFDFSAVDESMQRFLDEEADFDGISYILVDRDLGVIHRAEFGDHTPELISLLASGSKMPAATLLMALDNDESLDFDVRDPIADYLPYESLYGDRTVEQLLSNTSGLPGLLTLLLAPDLYASHECQYRPDGNLQDCVRLISTVEVPGIQPAGSAYSYGGSGWQIAGAVAELVSNSTWAQAFDAYIAEPCGMESFVYGNMWESLAEDDEFAWTGSLDSLLGLDNPNIEGGAVASLSDYAKLLEMQLNGGLCGDTRVLTAESIDFMREDRGGQFGSPYGLGWFINAPEEGAEDQSIIYTDPGLFGDMVWADFDRGIAGFVAIDRYIFPGSSVPVEFVSEQVIGAVAAEVDRAREEVGQ